MAEQQLASTGHHRLDEHPNHECIFFRYLLCFLSPSFSPVSRLSLPFAGRVCNAICNVFLLLVLFSSVALAQGSTVRVPFRTVKGMILFDATVNRKPAVFLLDTGAQRSIISTFANFVPANLKTTDNGEYLDAKIDLRLATRHLAKQPVLITNLIGASDQLGLPIDGIIGQDILRQFSAVRINYKAGLVEFEK